jgi:restriction system protein
MPIPTFDQMLQPILTLALSRPTSRRDAEAAMADHFALSPEDREARIPSGQATYMRSRAGWAMTFLTKAGLIEKTAPKVYSGTEKGRLFLAAHPNVTLGDLKSLEGWHEAWQTSAKKKTEDVDETDQTRTPVERLDAAVTALNTDLKDRLLAKILEQTPTFFEELVLDVLVAMGYGGSRDDAAEHLGGSGDEGIDGCIKQDPLGLDQIFVQAKRYAPDRPIDRKTLQAFFGSMTGQGVTKGIFITTSSFNDNALEFVSRGSQSKVVLIDGERLLDLMLRHHIGVRVQKHVKVLELDQNYFDEEE